MIVRFGLDERTKREVRGDEGEEGRGRAVRVESAAVATVVAVDKAVCGLSRDLPCRLLHRVTMIF